MKAYCGRDSLDKFIVGHFMKDGKHTDKMVGMFKIWMRLYTDEVPGFVKKYNPDYDRVGLTCFVHRYLYLQSDKVACAQLNTTEAEFKKRIKAFRASVIVALANAYDKDDFDLETEF